LADAPCADIFGKTENKEAKRDSLPLFDRLLKKKKSPTRADYPLSREAVGDFGRRTLRRYFRENRKQRGEARQFAVV